MRSRPRLRSGRSAAGPPGGAHACVASSSDAVGAGPAPVVARALDGPAAAPVHRSAGSSAASAAVAVPAAPVAVAAVPAGVAVPAVLRCRCRCPPPALPLAAVAGRRRHRRAVAVRRADRPRSFPRRAGLRPVGGPASPSPPRRRRASSPASRPLRLGRRGRPRRLAERPAVTARATRTVSATTASGACPPAGPRRRAVSSVVHLGEGPAGVVRAPAPRRAGRRRPRARRRRPGRAPPRPGSGGRSRPAVQPAVPTTRRPPSTAERTGERRRAATRPR